MVSSWPIISPGFSSLAVDFGWRRPYQDHDLRGPPNAGAVAEAITGSPGWPPSE